jgi:hypothetical protein
VEEKLKLSKMSLNELETPVTNIYKELKEERQEKVRNIFTENWSVSKIASEPPWWFQSFSFAQKIPNFFIALNTFKSPKTLIKVEKTNKIFDVCVSVRPSVRLSVCPGILCNAITFERNVRFQKFKRQFV